MKNDDCMNAWFAIGVNHNTITPFGLKRRASWSGPTLALHCMICFADLPSSLVTFVGGVDWMRCEAAAAAQDASVPERDHS